MYRTWVYLLDCPPTQNSVYFVQPSQTEWHKFEVLHKKRYTRKNSSKPLPHKNGCKNPTNIIEISIRKKEKKCLEKPVDSSKFKKII